MLISETGSNYAQARESAALSSSALMTPEIERSVPPSVTMSPVEQRDPEQAALDIAFGGMMTPEIAKRGGLEAALLFLLQERGELFETTLKTRLNESNATQTRMTEQVKERIETMRESIQEMDKAKKFGKMTEIFGWVGFAAAGVATLLTAGTASPAFLAASVGTLAVTGVLQIDGATGGHMMQAIVGDNQKAQMGLMIGISVALIAVSMGTAALAARGGIARGVLSGSGAAKSGQSGQSAQTAVGTAGAAGRQGGAAASGATSGFKQGVSDWAARAFTGKDNFLKFATGDHWLQKVSSMMAVSQSMAGSVTSIRGAHARYNAAKLTASSFEMQALEKKLSTYMELMGQTIEDMLSQIQGGHRVLSRQLNLAFEPKDAILRNI